MMNPSYRYRLNGRLTYTEPVSKYSQVSLGYRTSYNYQQSDKKTYRTGEDYDITGLLPDPLLSNAYKSSYTVHSLGPGFNYSKDRNTFAANVYYQRSSLSGEVIRTGSEEIKHAYNNVTYFMVGQFNLNRENTLRMFLRSYTDNPEVTQLQNVYDVSDAQYITRGNPDLRPSYSHNLSMHYVNSNAEKGRTFMLMFRAETTQDYITTSTRYRPTLEIDNTVYRPLQFTEWTNMDGYWDVRARASYGFPVNFIKSNLNLRGGVSYSRIPSLVDGERNNTGNLGYEAGVVLGSNISENVDFTLRGTARTTKPSIPSPLPEERTVISTIRLRRRSSSSSAGDSPSRAALLISSIWVLRTITTTAICSATCSWARRSFATSWGKSTSA